MSKTRERLKAVFSCLKIINRGRKGTLLVLLVSMQTIFHISVVCVDILMSFLEIFELWSYGYNG